MLSYYLSAAFRNLRRNKFYNVINVVGLAMAFWAALLIGFFVEDELDFDKWIPDHENIYRVSAVTSNSSNRIASGPSDTGLWLELEFPQLKAVTRMFRSSAVLTRKNFEFSESIEWVDSSFFDVFELPLIAGQIAGALDLPDSIVITEEIAEKYFQGSSPIGQILTIDGVHPMRVTAVLQELPLNSHLQFSILASGHGVFSPAAEQDRNPIMGLFGAKLWATRTYMRLNSEVDIESILQNLPDMMDRHAPLEGERKNSEIYGLDVLPIANIHLASTNSGQDGRDLRSVTTIGAIALMVVLAGTINFVNIMTAIGIKRAPEIAVRKTLGANRRNLFSQFMTETFLLVVIAVVFAVVLSYFSLPMFNAFMVRDISFELLFEQRPLFSAAVVILLIGISAGVYPSMVLSRHSPGHTFKQNGKQSRAGLVRQALSIIQFALMSALIISAYTIKGQAQFGMREALNNLEGPVITIVSSCDEPLTAAISQLSFVSNVACSWQIPQYGIGPGSAIWLKSDPQQRVSVRYTSVDVGFFELYDIDLIAGRLFSADRTGDIVKDNNWNNSESIVIKESTATELGFGSPEDAVGQILNWRRVFELPTNFTPVHDAEIIGVVADFQIGSIRNASPHVVFYVQRSQGQYISVKLKNSLQASNLEQIDEAWDVSGSLGPIERRFFDDSIEAMYQSIIKQSQLVALFATIAVFVALLGLIGLAAFVSENRTKEIGIRKILGGSRLGISKLLLWQFAKPVILSNILAWPLTYLALTQWLNGFERRIDLVYLSFLAASGITLVLALTTVLVYALKTAGMNPVRALRHE